MEKSLNKVELKGRVGQEPRIFNSESGGMVVRFNLATNELTKGKDNTFKEETAWHNIVAWFKRGMPDFKEIKKGQFLEIQGKIKYSKYLPPEGQERYITEIIASKIIIPQQG